MTATTATTRWDARDRGDVAAWDEPDGATPRGTLLVLPGRGETATCYERLGRRLSTDAYRVRLVPVDLDDLDATRAAVEATLAEEGLPRPFVLVGSDSGANLAARLVENLPVEGAVLAGIALPGSTTAGSWESQVETRTACPVHRRVIGDDDSFDRDALSRPLPWDDVGPLRTGKPVLALHGTDDVVSPAASALAAYAGAVTARVLLVRGGRHDVLNDVSHRSVAATVVLFLESLRLGADLPDLVAPAGSADEAR